MNAYQFFKANAGYSYDPQLETPEQGKIKNARSLSKAERIARDKGYSFQWEIDQCCDSSEFSEELPSWELWSCLMIDSDGECVNSLHGIDFGRDGQPWGNSYKRVVEAELAIGIV